MGSNWVARQSFGMLKIRKGRILLSYACERRKKEDEERRKKMNQIEIFKFVFFKPVKGYWNYWSRYSIRILKGSSLKHFELLCLVFLGVEQLLRLGAAPLPSGNLGAAPLLSSFCLGAAPLLGFPGSCSHFKTWAILN